MIAKSDKSKPFPCKSCKATSLVPKTDEYIALLDAMKMCSGRFRYVSGGMGGLLVTGLRFDEVLMVTRSKGLSDSFVMQSLPEMEAHMVRGENARLEKESKKAQAKAGAKAKPKPPRRR